MGCGGETGLVSQGNLFVTGGKSFDTGRDVGVVVGEIEAGGGGEHNVIEIPGLELAHPGMFRAVKVKDCGLAAGFEDAVQFSEGAGNVGDVAQAVTHGGAVKGMGSAGDSEGIAFAPLEAVGAVGKAGLAALGGGGELGGGKVNAPHVPLGANGIGQEESEIATATAEV